MKEFKLPTTDKEIDEFINRLGDHFIAFRRGTKCINCAGKKKDGDMVCRKCEKAEQAMERMFEKGITVEYADGTKEKLVGTKNPRKSTIYSRKR